jgi:hypothetical protein
MAAGMAGSSAFSSNSCASRLKMFACMMPEGNEEGFFLVGGDEVAIGS